MWNNKSRTKYSIVSFLVFFAVEGGIIWLTWKSDDICKTHSIPGWISTTYFGTSMCYMMSAMFISYTWLIVHKTFLTTRSRILNELLSISLTVTIIAALSSALTFSNVFSSGSFCENFLSLNIPLNEIAVWIASVPLLFVDVSMNESEAVFPFASSLFITPLSLGLIVFGLLDVIKSEFLSVLLLALGDIFFTIALLVLLIGTVILFKPFSNKRPDIIPENIYGNQTNKTSKKTSIHYKLRLIILMSIILLYIIYFTTASRFNQNHITTFLFIIMNCFFKISFIFVTLNSFTYEIFDAYIKELHSNAARQAYLRFIMHEVRVPLSSISMGIDALQILKDDEDDNYGSDDNHYYPDDAQIESGNFPIQRVPFQPHGEGKRGDELQQTLSMMRDATAFMKNTLNSVLNIQKIEEGKLELKMEPFITSDLVHRVSRALQGALYAKRIRLRVYIEGNVPTEVIGDHNQIEHVLANFLSNAIKFSRESSDIEILVSVIGEGEGTVCHSKKSSENHMRSWMNFPVMMSGSVSSQLSSSLVRAEVGQEVVMVKFAVKDFGVGISEENQMKLFRPFVQIRPEELQHGEGSGIGLHLCKDIIDLHGGTVGCQSVEGEGSTFFFTVPLAIRREIVCSPPTKTTLTVDVSGVVHRPQSLQLVLGSPSDIGLRISPARVHLECETPTLSTASSALSPSHSESFSAGSHGVHSVLIVDDATSNRKLLEKLISRKRVVCHEACDGLEALRRVQQNIHGYQIIFMDNSMPVMNGLAATKAIRDLGYRNLIIGLTGHALDDDVSKFLSAGADLVILKPMNLKGLDDVFKDIQRNGYQSKIQFNIT